MTGIDREKKCFRPSYDRRMNKKLLTSADFREKYKSCRLVIKWCIVIIVEHCTLMFLIG